MVNVSFLLYNLNSVIYTLYFWLSRAATTKPKATKSQRDDLVAKRRNWLSRAATTKPKATKSQRDDLVAKRLV